MRHVYIVIDFISLEIYKYLSDEWKAKQDQGKTVSWGKLFFEPFLVFSDDLVILLATSPHPGTAADCRAPQGHKYLSLQP